MFELLPETVKAPASFTLSVDASSLGTIANVEFYGNGALLGTATAAPYSYVWNNVAAGFYTLSAKATDTLGQSTTSNFVNVISATPPVVSLTSPAANAVSPAPGSFTLTANAWGTSSGLKSVSFYSGATLLGTATNAPYTFTWNNVAAGSYGLTAIATDNNNVTASSGAVAVTVAGTNQPPTVSLTSPLTNSTTTAPGSFTLSANATSIGSTIARVDFYQGATLIGTATAAPYSFTWSNVPAGTYSLTGKATDLLNVATTSSPVGVTVNAASVQAYYIHADQLDTPRVITDTAGNTVWQWDNVDPFGNNMANENPNGQGAFSFNLRFPGQYFDRETNLNYNFYRDAYDSAVGRYIQSDPIGLRGGINTYTYVGGNPLSRIDPLGLAVYVGEHGAAFPSDPLQHTAIVLRPDSLADFNFPNNTSTLGGQPGGSWGKSWSPYGNLRSAPNYPGDSPGTACKPGPLKNLTLVPTPEGMTDTQFINALINAANSYKNDQPYALFPDPFGIFHNSNSYTSGVISKAGGTPPALPGIQPGYNEQLPLP